MKHTFLKLTTCLLLSFATISSAAGEETSGPQQMMADGYFLRESDDRLWHLRVIGEVPSPAGLYLVLHDAEGEIMLQRHVPHGNYPADAPLEIAFPPDGKQGDYRLLILGHQRDKLGLRMPISDLPLEVYGRNYFSAGHNQTPLYFQAPEGVGQLSAAAYGGNLQIYRDDELIADARKDGELKNRDWFVEFPVTPGETYRLMRDTFYLRSASGLFLTFDPDTWFLPNAPLQSIPWWQRVEP